MKNYKIRGAKRTAIGILEIIAAFGVALVCGALLLPVGILTFIWGYFTEDGIVYMQVACGVVAYTGIVFLLCGIGNLRTVGRYRRLIETLSPGIPVPLELVSGTLKRKRSHVLRDVVRMQDEGHFDGICVLADCLVLENDRFPLPLMIGTEEGRGFAEGKKMFSGKYVIKEIDIEEASPYVSHGTIEEEDSGDVVLAAGRSLKDEIITLGKQTGNERICKCTGEIGSMVSQMLSFIEDKPEKAHSIHQTVEYDLPAICSLLRDYCELDRQSIKGENIMAGLRKIEEAMETASYNVKQELDMLYQDKVMNITVDIEVMQSMMSEKNCSMQDMASEERGG